MQGSPASELKADVLKDNKFRGLLTVDELKNAEMAIIKFCQRRQFSDQFDACRMAEVPVRTALSLSSVPNSESWWGRYA